MKPSRKRARYDAKNVDQYGDMSGRIFISHLDKIGTRLIGEKKGFHKSRISGLLSKKCNCTSARLQCAFNEASP
jgi:hypothetical protein